MFAKHATCQGWPIWIWCFEGSESTSIDSCDSWRASYMLNRAIIFFRCTNTLYPVWNASGAGGFCNSLLRWRFDLRISIDSCRSVSLDQACTWCIAYVPHFKFSGPTFEPSYINGSNSFFVLIIAWDRSQAYVVLVVRDMSEEGNLLFSDHVKFLKKPRLCNSVGRSSGNCFSIRAHIGIMILWRVKYQSSVIAPKTRKLL